MARRGRSEIVAILLAAGISLALNLIVAGLVWAAVRGGTSPNDAGLLGENTTQVLTGWGGGIIGVLGAYVGYSFGKRQNGSGGPSPPGAEEPLDQGS